MGLEGGNVVSSAVEEGRERRGRALLAGKRTRLYAPNLGRMQACERE
ncbi:hypothetical protein KSC_020720 [Ktedonobacter sp. SOSP1-52]|nr:hypothetical protein KSC_020720 [Ktedonobacter sp. SOSP1-52]